MSRLRIASPCSMRWEDMEGDDHSRHCSACKLSVLNVAAMTRQEVADAVRLREGRLCMRLLRRADGTVITKDCPVGARTVRQRIAKSLMVCVTMFASAMGLTWYERRQEDIGESTSGVTGRSIPSSTGAVSSEYRPPETGIAFPEN